MGNPIRFILTAGQASEFGQAFALIEGFSADYILADKGYDSNVFITEIERTGARPVIPPRRSRIIQREYDKELYKERNLVERLFQKLTRLPLCLSYLKESFWHRARSCCHITQAG
ncbi:MAG: transposase [Endozoicomonas sp.]|uniref:transposase n=1 Tax=Endozoicomonas sp. TaxID=1892382 RepID=UPI003D9B0F52